MSGWILLHRKLRRKAYYRDSHYPHLWMHLIFEASFEPREIEWHGQRIRLERGQLLASIRTLSEQTGIEKSKIDRILETFQNENQIAQEKTRRYRIITIKNYDEYQKPINETNVEVRHRMPKSEPQSETVTETVNETVNNSIIADKQRASGDEFSTGETVNETPTETVNETVKPKKRDSDTFKNKNNYINNYINNYTARGEPVNNSNERSTSVDIFSDQKKSNAAAPRIIPAVRSYCDLRQELTDMPEEPAWVKTERAKAGKETKALKRLWAEFGEVMFVRLLTRFFKDATDSGKYIRENGYRPSLIWSRIDYYRSLIPEGADSSDEYGVVQNEDSDYPEVLIDFPVGYDSLKTLLKMRLSAAEWQMWFGNGTLSTIERHGGEICLSFNSAEEHDRFVREVLPLIDQIKEEIEV